MVKVVFPVSRFYAEVEKWIDAGLIPELAVQRAMLSLGEEFLIQVEEVALIGWPLGSVNVSGKYRSKIFQTRKGETYIKRYTIPKDPKSDKQLAQRNVVRTASANWNAFTEPEKDYWRNLAKGDPMLNGYTCYFKSVCEK